LPLAGEELLASTFIFFSRLAGFAFGELPSVGS